MVPARHGVFPDRATILNSCFTEIRSSRSFGISMMGDRPSRKASSMQSADARRRGQPAMPRSTAADPYPPRAAAARRQAPLLAQLVVEGDGGDGGVAGEVVWRQLSELDPVRGRVEIDPHVVERPRQLFGERDHLVEVVGRRLRRLDREHHVEPVILPRHVQPRPVRREIGEGRQRGAPEIVDAVVPRSAVEDLDERALAVEHLELVLAERLALGRCRGAARRRSGA